ncbi:UNVERIFIED_CONTAM: hypothetical protein FKN15_048991 [Acipenser sinensis]
MMCRVSHIVRGAQVHVLAVQSLPSSLGISVEAATSGTVSPHRATAYPTGQTPSELRQNLQGWPISSRGRWLADIRCRVPGCRRESWLGRGIGGRPLNLQTS